MGTTAELVAGEFGIDREAQDRFALESHRRAAAAWNEGRFAEETIPIELAEGEFRRDESVRHNASLEALAKLKPVFKQDGTVTAGNAPGMNDGAAAVVLMSAKRARELGITPMAAIRASATSGVEPKWVMMAPVGGVRNVLKRAGWQIGDVDLFELNEAFAVQAIAVTRELGISADRVNVNGGAVAIGHPIGASGARVLVTLLHEMKRRDANKGVAALCLGGGNSVALAVERA
jgi:acetyl-CoA C-acetyltransferase